MAAHDEALSPPDRRIFWQWVGQSVRPYLGWILLVLGALAIFLGWVGVSGQSLTAKQLPYLVSGGLAGLALIVVGSVFLATDSFRRNVNRLDGLERKVDDLYALLVLEPSEPGADPPVEAETTGYVALPTASTFHRPTCRLVTGKPGVVAVSAEEIATRSLEPCPVCDPMSR